MSLATVAVADETLNGAGATFPAPVYSAWAFEYSKVTGTKLNYQSIGSGGGQRQIVERTVDFGASDDPLSSEKLAKGNLLQFPTVVGGITPVVNIAGIKPGELKLDPAAHCKIFLGEIKLWMTRRSKPEPKSNLPPTRSPWPPVGRPGTTAILHYLAKPAWKEKVDEENQLSGLWVSAARGMKV
jgi:phosphate transport system substrate-binding protein